MRYFSLAFLLTFLLQFLITLFAPVPAEASTYVSSGYLDASNTLDETDLFTELYDGSGLLISGFVPNGFTGVMGLPTGHVSYLFTDEFIVPGLGEIFDDNTSIREDFTFNPIDILSGPILPGESEASPFAMTGSINISGVLSRDIVGRGMVTAQWFSDPGLLGAYDINFAFVAEPSALTLLAFGLFAIGVITSLRHRSTTGSDDQ
jgi:hypothetical protein